MRNIENIISVGDGGDVKVLAIDEDSGKLKLSRKAALADKRPGQSAGFAVELGSAPRGRVGCGSARGTEAPKPSASGPRVSRGSPLGLPRLPFFHCLWRLCRAVPALQRGGPSSYSDANMLMRQAALITALAAAGQAAFDACGEPTKGPVLGGIDIVDAWAKALKARNATAPSQGPRLPHMAEAPPLRGSAEHAFTTRDGFALHFATEANRDAYAADPAKYALGAGGYCGLGASGRDPRCPEGGHCRGPACGTSPLTFQISGVDGKLYFFLGAGARQIFNEDEKASVAGAAAKVKAVEEATGRACFNTDLLGCRTPGSMPGPGAATRRARAPGASA